MHNVRVKFYLGQDEDDSLGVGVSDSSAELLQRGKEKCHPPLSSRWWPMTLNCAVDTFEVLSIDTEAFNCHHGQTS